MGSKNRRAVLGSAALAGAAFLGAGRSAWADSLQNYWVQGSQAQLAAAGFTTTGSGIVIGQNEPGDPNVFGGVGSNVAPTSSLADGNPNLLATQVFIDSPTPSRKNHASEVAGVMVSTIPGQGGIAPGSQVVSDNTADVAQNAKGTYASANLLNLISSKYVVNMSWGLNVLNAPASFPGGNNGDNFITPFVDWAATQYNTLVVVAGNEGSNANSNTASGSPSDAFNVLNVGATGARTSVNAGVNYTMLAPYTQSNTTADKSPITHYGREKTDLVAPGGDPFNELNLIGAGGTYPAGYQGTLATPPASGFFDQFYSTAGGFTSPGASYSSTDTYFGHGTAPNISTDTSTGSAYITPTDGTTSAAGNIVPDTIAGTSFAAPLVSGAAALVDSYGNANGLSVDHRLIKALMMNGAVKQFNVGGSIVNLTNTTGGTWARLAGVGTTPTCPGFPVGFSPTVRPGLDPNLGTGEMNVVNTLTNYAAGQQAPTNVSGNNVNPTGWDVRTVAAGAAANTIVYKYDFSLANVVNNTIGSLGSFEATLDWDDVVTNSTGSTYTTDSIFSRNTATSNYQPTGGVAAPLLTDLDLYLFQVNPDGTLGNNIDYSTSDIDNVEYVYGTNLAAGSYELDVTNSQYAAPSATTYGLAWSLTYVPEPSTTVIMCFGGISLLMRRRRLA